MVLAGFGAIPRSLAVDSKNNVQRDVKWNNGDVTLVGTLSLPPIAGKVPGVVLVAGSGPEDRNETVGIQKPFQTIADFLTKQGIAVLRYDKRGCGKSTGDFGHAHLSDFVSDARSALAFLSQQTEVDSGHLGLVGHSEGAVVVPQVAHLDQKVRFMILLGAPTISGEDTFYLQQERFCQSVGEAEAVRRASREWQKQVVEILGGTKTSPDTEKALQQFFVQSNDTPNLAANIKQGILQDINGSAAALSLPWVKDLMKLKPREYLERISCPTLFLYGGKDTQVPPDVMVPALRDALKKSSNHQIVIAEITGLNHLFQPAVTGGPEEYDAIKEPFSPVALTLMSNWIANGPVKQSAQ